MPKELVAKLGNEIVKNLNMPEVNENLTSRGIDVIASTPAEFEGFMKSEVLEMGQGGQRIRLAAGLKGRSIRDASTESRLADARASAFCNR